MWRKVALAFLLLLISVILTGCGGGSASPVEQAIAWISGIVSKFRGEPIQNATVTLKETSQSARTDSAGRFRFSTSYRGAGTLRVEASGYLPLEWPVEVTDQGTSVHLRLVSLSDHDPALFSTLTGATNTNGTMRWPDGTVYYYIDRSGPWRPEFDAVLRDAFTMWSMATRRAITFAEGDASSPLNIRFVQSNPCGYTYAAGCAAPTELDADGSIRRAIIELMAQYSTDPGLALHEIGHTLSLIGHSPNQSDVMYRQMNGVTSPSNAEAAVAAVLYSNPPGTTMPNITLPQPSIPAVAQADIRLYGQAAVPASSWPSQVTPGPEEAVGWWEALVCRFQLFAPLCGGGWFSWGIGF